MRELYSFQLKGNLGDQPEKQHCVTHNSWAWERGVQRAHLQAVLEGSGVRTDLISILQDSVIEDEGFTPLLHQHVGLSNEKTPDGEGEEPQYSKATTAQDQGFLCSLGSIFNLGTVFFQIQFFFKYF